VLLCNDCQQKVTHPLFFHSHYFTTIRCDCKEQLKMALEYIGKNGGAIVYMQQEGRGIGLANKVAAYALQDAGMDTVDANIHLGFPEDARQYGAVPSILNDMKIGSIKLLTNNPLKVQRLRALGVEIKGTEPMVVESTNPYNHKYLESKHDRMNHTNLSPLFVKNGIVKNGNMAPKRKSSSSAAEKPYVSEGEEMASNAVQMSLTPVGDGQATEDDTQLGASAAEDGYCFGRQSVEDAIIAVKDGKMVVVVDDMDRENEGDLIMAAEACTPEDMATIVRYSSGVVCVGMEGERMDALKLPAMVTNNEDPKGTAFSVTVDATKEHGTF
jgi:GTP cyclohydrolase II